MREITLHRVTRETDITLSCNLDGNGTFSGGSGIGFFDHMLSAFSVHSGIDLSLKMTGDLEVDCHHSVEDVGIVLGQALGQLADKNAIQRYGNFYIPMDESLAFCSLDLGGRPFLVFDAAFQNPTVGQFDCCMTVEFFRAVAMNAGMTLHLRLLYGENDHHKIEALFKAFAHALSPAIALRADGPLSSKGVLG